MPRLTTKEYIYVYTEDNIDEGGAGDDENEDFENSDEWEEMPDEEPDEAEIEPKNGEKVTSSDIERILADRKEAGLDEDEDDREDELEDFEEDDDGEDFIVIQSAWRNDRKQHLG